MAVLPPSLVVQIRTAAGLAAGICLCTMAAIVATIVTHYPDNHVGADIRLGYVSTGAALLAGVAAWRWGAMRWSVAAALIGFALLTATFLFVADQWNLVVGYELWLERGMPSFGAAPGWW